MNTHHLPQELYEAFIDYLADSPSDLQHCSLVAKSWLPRCRTHLFRRLHISRVGFSGPNEDELAQRKDIMLRSYEHLSCVPEVTRCVKALRISDTMIRDAGSRFGGVHSEYEQDSDSERQILMHDAHPLYLSTLPLSFTHIEFLAYDWTSPHYRHDAQSGTRFLKALSRILRSSMSGIKGLDLRTSGSHVRVIVPRPAEIHADMDTPFDFFECLAAHAPAVQTLCLWGIIYQDCDRIMVSDDIIRQVLRSSSKAWGPLVGGNRITLKRFYTRTLRTHYRNARVILFENRYLTLTNLERLAMDGTDIVLFVDRNDFLRNLTHLTLYDSIFEYQPDRWTYNKARLSLPSLTHLQLVLGHYASILTLCRVILGPSKGGPAVPKENGSQKEYPGFDIDLLPSPNVDLPRTRSPLHLHLELQEKYGAEPDLGDRTRIDDTLYSYLDLNDTDASFERNSEQSGILSHITANRPGAFLRVMWPRTAGTGMLQPAEGDVWWDSSRW